MSPGVVTGRRKLDVKTRKRFALRLFGAIEETFGSYERFKKELPTNGVGVSESTVRGWLPPLDGPRGLKREPKKGSYVREIDWQSLKAPDIVTLREVASILDLSIDYLLGYAVPKRRSDRAAVNELAPGLISHVAQQTLERSATSYHDGLAATLKGDLVVRNPGTEETDAQVGDALANGDVVVSPLLALRVKNPRLFLDDVCKWVADRSSELEAQNDQKTRDLVLKEVRRLRRNVPAIAQASGTSESDVMGILLNAALDPLSRHAQSATLDLAHTDMRTRNNRLPLDAASEWVADAVRDALQEGASNKAPPSSHKRRSPRKR